MKYAHMTIPAVTVSALLSAGVLVAPSAAAAPSSSLQLVTSSSSVTSYRYAQFGVLLDVGAYVAAPHSTFEVRLHRKSYADPIVATQIIDPDGKAHKRTLPKGLVKDFSGLPGFMHISLTDASGKKVLDRTQEFCPNDPPSRMRPNSVPLSKYPQSGCANNPFTLGSVWGIPAGWGMDTESYTDPVQLPNGTYTATFNVTKTYQKLFGISGRQHRVKMTVEDRPTAMSMARPNAERSPKPNATRPTGPARVPTWAEPDLRSLPAWGISIAEDSGSSTGAASARASTDPAKDYLRFGATIWNAGPAPLVVDGFRRSGTDTMDAYQFFLDSNGKQVGYKPAGTMQWDPRPGHMHWHFLEFARYQLLSAAKKVVVRSQKEGFCLADDDAIDYTVKNAVWQPYNTSLLTSCGTIGSISVREALDVGNGDTYVQQKPGQSFDVTGLPNGVYYIQVTANPQKLLSETGGAFSTSLRKVILGGSPGHRTVTVPPVGLVDSH